MLDIVYSYILITYAKLNIVSRKKPVIAHIVLFHAHKCCIAVCFGVLHRRFLCVPHTFSACKYKLIERIVKTCYEMQSDQSSALATMQKRLNQIEKEIGNVMSAIKQGIVTESTKTELLKLEDEKSNLQANIAKEQIKHPFLSKNQIEYWICKFRDTDIANIEQKQRLIDVFINAIYVYDDKVLITFNYKDSEKCVDFKDIQKLQIKRRALIIKVRL